jgi:hypothetical protein
MNQVRVLNFPTNDSISLTLHSLNTVIDNIFHLFDVVYDKVVGSGEHVNKFSGSAAYRELLYQLNNYQFIK